MADPKKKSPKEKVATANIKRVTKTIKKRPTNKKTLTYKASKADSVKNPENQPYVTEVGFNKGKKNSEVTQEEFNKRYGIKW